MLVPPAKRPPFYATASREELLHLQRVYDQNSSKCFLSCLTGNDTLSEYFQHQYKWTATVAKGHVHRSILGLKAFGGALFVFSRVGPSASVGDGGIIAAVVCWLAVTTLLYLDCAVRPAGTATASTPLESDDTDSCAKCALTQRPAMTHHCRHCNACVLRMDHHCQVCPMSHAWHFFFFFFLTVVLVLTQWLDNCIGRDNHAHFIAYVLNMFGLTCVGLTSMVHCVVEQCRAHALAVGAPARGVVWPWDAIAFFPAVALFVGFVLIGAWCAALAWLVVTQLCNVMQGTTTLDRLTRARRTVKSSLPWSPVVWGRNWFAFFGSRWWCPWLPPHWSRAYATKAFHEQ